MFEAYTRNKSESKAVVKFEGPGVTIRKTKVIGFNEEAAKAFDFANKPFVALFYDKESARIGFQFSVDPDDPGAKKIGKVNKAWTTAIHGFVKKYQIALPEKSCRLPLLFDEESGLHYVDMKSVAAA